MPTLNSSVALVSPEHRLPVVDWGLIDYSAALERQEELVEKVAAEASPGVIVYCTHPPLVTLGRKTQEGDVFAWRGPTVEISRGGRATYHGPSQLLIYPVYNLDRAPGPARRDLHRYLRSLEKALVLTLAEFGIPATPPRDKADPSGKRTGVWVGERKIASIGIAVRKWVTYHGVALNVEHDPQAFQGLRPCGFSASTMTSMEECTKRQIDRAQLKTVLGEKLEFTLRPCSSESGQMAGR